MKNAIHMLYGGPNERKDDLLNSFIFTTDQGTVIVVDGGHSFDLPHLTKRLQEITGEQKPHIDGWILTHLHEDHVEAFLSMLETCPDSFEIDKIIYGAMTDISWAAKDGPATVRTFLNFYRPLPTFKQKSHSPVVGETFFIKEIKFEILHTAGAQLRVNNCNNNSLVFKATWGGKSALFLGDCEVEAGNKLLERWGLTGVLKADICQMAHHGQCGVDFPVYQAISPEICLWPTPKYLWDNDLGKGYNTFTFKTIEVQGWMKSLGVKSNYVIKDGDQVLEF
ncbi:MAG: MBL fold metallo-hydrolase [Clostridia bacterium]|nr:MBL fold metallo-hydrolase [Clostridia bacterium]